MKYYLYISDTKVDILRSQIPKSLFQRITSEVNIGVKFLSASISKKETEITRVSKLSEVVKYIEKNFQIGTPENPKAYFRGMLPMNWGGMAAENEEAVVFFVGKSKGTFVGLGGSIEHIIGQQGMSGQGYHSHMPFLLSVLAAELDLKGARPTFQEGDAPPLSDEQVKAMALEMVTRTVIPLGYNHKIKPPQPLPKQKLEFLAKTLLNGYAGRMTSVGWEDTDERVVLGTPLYVALADQ